MEETDVQEEFKEDPVETRVCLRAFLRTLVRSHHFLTD